MADSGLLVGPRLNASGAGESRAGLLIRVGGGEARVWEWFNDVHANDRLIQVSSRLAALRFQLQPGAAPGS